MVSLWNLRPIERFHLENNLSFGGVFTKYSQNPLSGMFFGRRQNGQKRESWKSVEIWVVLEINGLQGSKFQQNTRSKTPLVFS